MVRINGEDRDVAGISLSQLLEKDNYNKSRLAVECNGEIIPKKLYDDTILKDNDKLEVVSFVGGG